MRTTPRVILILKQASSATRRCETLAKKTNMTHILNFQVKKKLFEIVEILSNLGVRSSVLKGIIFHVVNWSHDFR